MSQKKSSPAARRPILTPERRSVVAFLYSTQSPRGLAAVAIGCKLSQDAALQVLEELEVRSVAIRLNSGWTVHPLTRECMQVAGGVGEVAPEEARS